MQRHFLCRRKSLCCKGQGLEQGCAGDAAWEGVEGASRQEQGCSAGWLGPSGGTARRPEVQGPSPLVTSGQTQWSLSLCLTMGMSRCARLLCVYSLAQGHLRHPPRVLLGASCRHNGHGSERTVFMWK